MEEVQIVTAESVLAIFACVTALDASLAVVIEPSAGVSEMSFPSLAAVTAPSTISAVEMLATPSVAACIDQIVPSHVQVRVPTV